MRTGLRPNDATEHILLYGSVYTVAGHTIFAPKHVRVRENELVHHELDDHARQPMRDRVAQHEHVVAAAGLEVREDGLRRVRHRAVVIVDGLAHKQRAKVRGLGRQRRGWDAG